MDKVSIITPVYQCERYISETIRSVRNQTYTNWEMILVDDCSADKSPDIMQIIRLRLVVGFALWNKLNDSVLRA